MKEITPKKPILSGWSNFLDATSFSLSSYLKYDSNQLRDDPRIQAIDKISEELRAVLIENLTKIQDCFEILTKNFLGDDGEKCLCLEWLTRMINKALDDFHDNIQHTIDEAGLNDDE